jgi:hypothetical protein
MLQEMSEEVVEAETCSSCSTSSIAELQIIGEKAIRICPDKLREILTVLNHPPRLREEIIKRAKGE